MNHRSVARRAVEVLVIGLVVSPAVRDHDSFPLSTYPMYAFARGREAALSTARGFDAAGRPLALSMGQIAGTDDPLVAADRVRSAVSSDAAAELCTRILGRAPDAMVVVVVTERHDIVAAARGARSLLDSQEHARCER